MRARKIKIRIRKGWFPIFIPAVRISLLKRISRFAAKHYFKSQGYSDHKAKQTVKKFQIAVNQESIHEIQESVNMFFDEIAGLEPFVLADVQIIEEKLSVKIEII